MRRFDTHALLETIRLEAKEVTYTALTDSVAKPHAVQLMNVFQTKGRESDATVVILREGDNMGYEGEPWASTSRLLSVFSRARHKIVILPVGDALHPWLPSRASVPNSKQRVYVPDYTAVIPRVLPKQHARVLGGSAKLAPGHSGILRRFLGIIVPMSPGGQGGRRTPRRT